MPLVDPETEEEVSELFTEQLSTSGVPPGLVMEFVQ